MSFIDKIKAALNRFMQGRHGADELSMALLIAGLVLSIFGRLLPFPLLPMLLSLALYIYAMFRVFSRDHEKRYAENQKYLAFTHGTLRQSFMRLKNMRKYKYFKCPECHSWIRLPRKVGEVTVNCGKCHHTFKQKA